MSFVKFCKRALQYQLSPWQMEWAQRFDAGDTRLGFNFPNSGAQDAFELVAMMTLYISIIERRVVYLICPDKESAIGFNHLAKNLLVDSFFYNKSTFLCGEGMYASFRPSDGEEVLFNIAIPPGNPLGGHTDADYVVLHPHKIGALRQKCAIRRAHRVIYPNVSPRSQCSSRPRNPSRS